MEWLNVFLLLILTVLGISALYIDSCTEDNDTSGSVKAGQSNVEQHGSMYASVDLEGKTEEIFFNVDAIDEALAETSIDKRIEETIDPKTEKVVDPTPNPREMQVSFKNKCGKRVKLWWKGFDNDNVLQADMFPNDEMKINTFFGHEFFFTPADNEKEKLYSVRMESHIDLIELLAPDEMAKRGKEFEREKNEFMKEYYQKTGRRWKNYYPRAPVEHFVYDVNHTGQHFGPRSNSTQFRNCPTILYEFDEFVEILNALETKELDYKTKEFEQLHIARMEREEKEKDDRNYFHHVPVYSSFTDYFELKDSTRNLSLNYKIVRYNGTVLCQDLNEMDDVVDMQVLCTQPRVLHIPKFLSDAECQHVIEVGHYLGLRRSTVSETAIKSLDRTSSTVWLERKMSPVIDNIVRRVGDAVGIDESLLFLNASSESLQFVHYLDGELYRPHVDYGTDTPNNRFITFLMYLNDVPEGGYTSFPNADASCKGESGYFGVKPVQGSAAWFYDLFEDGNVDPMTLHFAEPPTNGSEKFMTNLWIWDPFFK